jgi:precorrin-6Y C5,15-methyltransferase (decarboxylating)
VNTQHTQRILVIGVTGAGRESLPAPQLARVLGADLLVGGDRQLAYFADAAGEKLSMSCGIGAAAERLRAARDVGQRAVVVASGDPLCYGIGSSLRRYFAAEELEFVPAPSAYQLAFAALGEPWQDAALLSAHNRSLDIVSQGVQRASKAAILTDLRHTPPVVAQALIEDGLPSATACAVCENLGQADQRVVRATLAEVAAQAFAPLNVLVVWNDDAAEGG